MDTQEVAYRSAKYEHRPNFMSDTHFDGVSECSSIMEIGDFDGKKTPKSIFGFFLRDSHSLNFGLCRSHFMLNTNTHRSPQMNRS